MNGNFEANVRLVSRTVLMWAITGVYLYLVATGVIEYEGFQTLVLPLITGYIGGESTLRLAAGG